jgi:hypothetical protein
LKTRWKILIGLGVLLLLLGGTSWLSLRQQPESRLEAYRKTLIAKSEKLTWAEVLPPPTPPESNGLREVQMAFSLLGEGSVEVPYAMQMVAPGRAMVGHRQPDVRSDSFTNSWAEFVANQATNRPALDWLRLACEKPRLDFLLDYRMGYKMTFTNLGATKHATQRLIAATLCDLHNANPAGAATNLAIVLDLVQKNETDGVLISQLVRLAMVGIAVAPTWELLQATNVTDAQLAMIQASWERLNFLRDAESAYTMERVWGVNMIQKLRLSHDDCVELLNISVMASKMFSPGSSSSSSSGPSWLPDWEGMTEGARNKTAEMLWRSSLSYEDELRTLQTDQIILEVLRQMRTNQNGFFKADYDVMNTRLSKLPPARTGRLAAVMTTLKIPDCAGAFSAAGFLNAVLKTLRMEAARDLTVTAIALKRYELKHGQLPEKLDQLVPEFLPAVPIDCFSGKPLHYQLQTTGAYLLYSVGEDGHDDGGDPTSTDPSSHSFSWLSPKVRDLVWPQPATQTEIDAYFAHPPK